MLKGTGGMIKEGLPTKDWNQTAKDNWNKGKEKMQKKINSMRWGVLGRAAVKKKVGQK